MPSITIQSFYRGIANNIKSDTEDMSDALRIDPYRNYPYLEPGYYITDISGSVASVIVDKILWMETHIESSALFTYALGDGGNIYRIPASADSSVTNLQSGFGSMTDTGGMKIYKGTTEYAYYANDTSVGRMTLGSNPTFNNTFITGLASGPHPMEVFLGKLYIANGSNLYEVDSTDAVSSTKKLNPGLPANYIIRAMKVDQSGQKLMMAASLGNTGSFDTDVRVFGWEGFTAQYNYEYSIGDNRVTSLMNANGPLLSFGNNFYGTTIRNFDGNSFVQKRLIKGGYNPPRPGAVDMIGDLAAWGSDGPAANIYTYGSWQEGMPPVFNQPIGVVTGSITNITALKTIQSYVLNADGTLNTTGRLYFAGYTGTTYKLYKAETQITQDTSNFDAGSIFYSQYYEFPSEAKITKVTFHFKSAIDSQNFSPIIQSENATDTNLALVSGSVYSGNYAEVATDSAGNPLSVLTGLFRLKIQNNVYKHWNISKIVIDYDPIGRP